MKHTILFILFLVIGSQSIFAQDKLLSIEPGVVKESFAVDLSDAFLDLELHADVKNTSGEDISLKWVRYELDKPLMWETQVCDNVTCYVPIVSSNIDATLGIDEPVIIKADSTMPLIFHVLPNGMSGSGKFALDFSLTADPDSIIATVEYEVEVNNVTSTDDIIDLGAIRTFPNPTTEYFELTNSEHVDQLFIVNMVGRHVRTFEAYPGKRYSMFGLPDGIYLVSLVNRQKGILKTVRVGKRSLRP